MVFHEKHDLCWKKKNRTGAPVERWELPFGVDILQNRLLHEAALQKQSTHSVKLGLQIQFLNSVELFFYAFSIEVSHDSELIVTSFLFLVLEEIYSVNHWLFTHYT